MSVRRKFPDEEYRKSFRTPSGFQHLGESSANGDHTHLALIYESKEELLASVLPFLQSGLERGKFCIYVTSETPQAILLETMDTADFNFKAALEAGDLILLTEEEAYLENGEFDLKRMTESFQELTAKVDNEGYDGLRIAGEATWALEDDQRINHLVEYEEAINNYFRGRDCTALCIFSRNHFPPAILKKVIQTHPQLVFGGTVIQNFYYVPQGEHSDGENTLQMVERQIQSLIEYTHELREHEAWLTGQKEAFREAVKGAPLKTSLGVLIRTTIKQIEGDVRAAFYTAGTDGKRLHHVTGMPEAYAEAVDGFEIGPDSQACGLAMYKGEPVITPDVRKDPKWKPLIELTEEFDYRACWDFPVRTAGGPTLGTFAMYFREPRDATEYELKYIGILAHAAAIIISQYNEAEDHKQAEEDLRKREERLSAFIETSSATAFRINPDWTELYHRYGKTSRSYTSGSNTVLVDKYIPPNDQPVVRKNIAKAIQTKSAFEMEHRVIKKDGSVGWSASRAIPIMKEGEIVEWFGTASDITKRKQQEKREQFLLKLNDALRLLSDAVEIKQAVTRIVGEQIQADRALYAEIGSDGESIHIADSYSCKSLSKIEGTLNVKDFSSAVVDSLRSGKTIVVEDVSALPGITEEEIDAYAALDIASIVAVPLVKGDRWVSNLIIYHSSFRRWTAEEVQLLEEAAELTWAAVERARAEESLYENEERLRLALDVEELGLWQFDLQNQSLMMSDICKQNLGLTPDIALNFKQFQQMMHPEDRDLWSEKLRKTLQNGEMLSAEFRFSRPSGKINWIYAKGRVLNNSEGTRAKIIGITQNITHRKKQEKLEQEQSRLLKYIASDRSLRDTLTALCEAIPLLGQGVRASIVLVDNEKSTFQTAIAPDLLPSWGKAPDGTPVDDLQIGTCGEAIFNGEAIGCKNVKEDEQRSDEWQNLCLANGIMATYSVPIFDDKGNTRGSFMLCFSIPREPNEWELQLVEFGAQISSIALKRHQTKKMIREYNGRLEEKVEQRTKKLVTYQTKLRKLVNRLSKAEEQERHWLAEELHDNLGQLLAVSKMKLDFAGLDSKDTNISEAADLLDESIV
jgi:PAS domain S-box-containing protein